MSVRENLVAVLEGETPQVTPLAVYNWNMGTITAEELATAMQQPEWKSLLDMGLGIFCHCECITTVEHGVETTVEQTAYQGNPVEIITKKTPVGEIKKITGNNNAWHIEDWIKEPQDYLVAKWIVEHTELVPQYERVAEFEAVVGDYGLTLLMGSGNWLHRSPLMKINIDFAGTETFCMDLAMEVPELFELNVALLKQFIKEQELMAAAPGRYVKWLENLTIGMLGPQRYQDLVVPVYEQCVPILEAGNKRVMVHYDGELKMIADAIGKAPFHMLDSLSEPPEGDMLIEECRASWPDKVLLANISANVFDLPNSELAAAIADKVARAGRRGFCLEISEFRPESWQRAFPVIVETLNKLK